MNFIEKTHKKKSAFKGQVLSVRADDIILPDGKKATREFVEHPGAVAVLAFVDKTNIVLVRQYRYPMGEVTYEIPAGKLDANEKLASCVKRELAEETGFKAKNIRKINSFWPTPAFSDEILHIFVATGLVRGKHNPDDDEFIDSVELPFKEALKWVKNGKIKDAKTIVALLLWACLKNKTL